MGKISRRKFLKRAAQAAAGAAGLATGCQGVKTAPGPLTARERTLLVQPQIAGDWPVYRGDVGLTGRALLPGELREPPAVAWSYKIEGAEAWVVIDPRTAEALPRPPAQDRPSLPSSAQYLHSPEGRKWGLGAKLVDLYGDGHRMADPARAAKLLPDVPGLQTIEFQPASGSGGGDRQQAVCHAYDGGKKREVWRSEAFDTIQNTNFLIADVDHDGKLEVAFAPHYRVIVFDGQTGRTKYFLKIHDLRNYGFFCATDVNRDGLLDFVIIADFAMHLDVVENRGDRLRLLWRRDIESDIQNKSRIVRPGPNPVFDMNGDGRIELVTNLFNEKADGRWHVMAYDALTGETVLDLPERYLSGAADVNGDGVPELFVARAEGLYVPNSSELGLLRVKGREAQPLWTHPRGRWLTRPTALPLTHTTIVANGTEDVVTGRIQAPNRPKAGPEKAPRGEPPPLANVGFLIADPQADGSERCRAYSIGPDGKVAESWQVELPARSSLRIHACADLDGDGADETLISFRPLGPDAVPVIVAQRAGARLVGLDRTAVPLGQVGAGETRPLVVAPLSPDQGPSVVFEGANRDILAVAPPVPDRSGLGKKSASPRVRWRVPGVGAAILADLGGDGRRAVVFADWAESGEGEIAAVDAGGKTLWRHRMSGFPGPQPTWNYGGITTWWVGRYTSKDRQDVWASARRSTMHSDEAWVLRGTDGQEVWHLEEVRTDKTPRERRGWGAGGSLVCSADVDGDGLDDIIGLYPVNYMAAKGSSGALIHSIEASSGVFEGVWAAYSRPMVADFNGDGHNELLWCGPYHHGLTTLEARVLWCHKGGASMAGMGDVDGDGRLELGFTGWERGQGLRCLDAATGAPKWDWPLKGNPRVDVCTADIDGDGCDEFLFAHETNLYAVGGKSGGPALVWQVSLPSAPGNLVLADVDRDGKTEILFIGADSTLYCLDRV